MGYEPPAPARAFGTFHDDYVKETFVPAAYGVHAQVGRQLEAALEELTATSCYAPGVVSDAASYPPMSRLVQSRLDTPPRGRRGASPQRLRESIAGISKLQQEARLWLQKLAAQEASMRQVSALQRSQLAAVQGTAFGGAGKWSPSPYRDPTPLQSPESVLRGAQISGKIIQELVTENDTWREEAQRLKLELHQERQRGGWLEQQLAKNGGRL